MSKQALQPGQNKRPMIPHSWIPRLGLAICLGLAMTAWILVWRIEQRRIQEKFHTQIAAIKDQITSRMVHHEQVLWGAEEFLSRQQNLPSREDWRHYVTALKLDQLNPGVQGLGFAKWIPLPELKAHIQQMRSEGYPDYSVHPGGPLPPEGGVSSIIYLEPFDERNQRAFSRDMFADPIRRAAMTRARDMNAVAISGRVTLFQETNTQIQAGTLLYVPAYRWGRSLDTVAQRREALLGWAYMPFRMQDLMAGILGTSFEGLNLAIYDGDSERGNDLIFDGALDTDGHKHNQAKVTRLNPSLTQRVTFAVAGRTWTLQATALPGFSANLGGGGHFLILALGLLASLVVFQLLGSLAKSEQEALVLADVRLERLELLLNSMIGLNQDITERKQVEEELKRVHERLLLATTAGGVGIWALDVVNNKLTWDDQMFRLYGIKPGAFGGAYETWKAGVHPEDAERRDAEVQMALRGEKEFNTEFRVLYPDGTVRHIAACAQVHLNALGQPVELLGTNHDITERKQAEVTLRETNAYLENLINYANAPIIVWDPEFRITRFNHAFEVLTGHAEAEVLSKSLEILFPAALVENSMALIRKTLTGERWETEEIKILNLDGTVRTVLWNSATLFASDGTTPMATIAQGQDITRRKQAEEALRKSEEEFRRLVWDMQVGVLLHGPQSEILLSNPKALELLALSEGQLLGKTSFDPEWNVIHEDGSPFPGPTHPVPQANATRQPVRGVVMGVFRPTPGDRVWLSVDAEPQLDEDGTVQRVVCTFMDITRRKQAEEEQSKLQAQLMQAQKMESLGNLAGGVAHDMNNVLGAILGMASANIDAQPAGSSAHRAFDTISKAAVRGGQMVKSLLSFARKSLAEERELDMNALLREEVHLLERTLQSKVRLDMDLETDLRPILGDASVLTHAVMNLCVNAVDAMPENGTLTLRTRNVDNDWIEVLVEDTGTGMPSEVLEQAMDPFFTTKEVGKGTGLGLSMAYRAVQAHHGQMAIQSSLGQGTRVRMRFPAWVRVDPAPEPAAEFPKEPSSRALNVLLVDDDAMFQSSLQEILAVLGHSATGVYSGEEALANLEAGFAPDVVILDMNMPGLGGMGTLPRLRALRPTVPVLISTGRADEAAMNLIKAYLFVTLLPKPFTMAELQKNLERLGRG